MDVVTDNVNSKGHFVLTKKWGDFILTGKLRGHAPIPLFRLSSASKNTDSSVFYTEIEKY